MDVIQRGPIVPLGPHGALHGAEEYLAPTRMLLPIPSVRRAAVKFSKLAQQAKDVRRFHLGVIVVGQHAPRKRLARVGGEDGQQIARKGVHAFRVVTDEGPVLETRCRDVETPVAEVRAMRRRMPRLPLKFAPSENFHALPGRELPPAVFGRGHARGLTQTTSTRNSKLPTLQTSARGMLFGGPSLGVPARSPVWSPAFRRWGARSLGFERFTQRKRGTPNELGVPPLGGRAGRAAWGSNGSRRVNARLRTSSESRL